MVCPGFVGWVYLPRVKFLSWGLNFLPQYLAGLILGYGVCAYGSMSRVCRVVCFNLGKVFIFIGLQGYFLANLLGNAFRVYWVSMLAKG